MNSIDELLDLRSSTIDHEAKAKIMNAINELYIRFPNETPQREALVEATIAYFSTDLRPDQFGDALAESRDTYDIAAARVRQVARLMMGEGATQAETARALKVDRMTVRKAMIR